MILATIFKEGVRFDGIILEPEETPPKHYVHDGNNFYYMTNEDKRMLQNRKVYK